LLANLLLPAFKKGYTSNDPQGISVTRPAGLITLYMHENKPAGA